MVLIVLGGAIITRLNINGSHVLEFHNVHAEMKNRDVLIGLPLILLSCTLIVNRMIHLVGLGGFRKLLSAALIYVYVLTMFGLVAYILFEFFYYPEITQTRTNFGYFTAWIGLSIYCTSEALRFKEHFKHNNSLKD